MRLIFIAEIVFILFSTSACKKCQRCANRCAICTYGAGYNSDTLCSTNFQSLGAFNTLVNSAKGWGQDCYTIPSTQYFEYCNAYRDTIRQRESEGFICEEN